MKGLRVAAWVLIGLALALVGADLVSSLEIGQPVIRTAREVLSLIPGVELGRMAGGGVGTAVNLVMDVPLWAMLGVLGLIATILVRPVE